MNKFLIAVGLVAGAVLFAHSAQAAVVLFGANLYHDTSTVRFGLGHTYATTTPIPYIWSVDGDIFVTGCFRTPAGCVSAPQFATSSAVSANNSVAKSVTSWCPAGYRAISGGGEVVSGNVEELGINNSHPTATSSGWTVSYSELILVLGNWQVRSHVNCVQ